MQRSDRLKTITRAVLAGPRRVDELVELTGASAITIRRDLAELEAEGALERFHGGAKAAMQRGDAYPFALRADLAGEVKRALAIAAAALIKPGDSVLLDNGTTTIALAGQVPDAGISVMPLSLHAVPLLAGRPSNHIVVPGGEVQQDDLSFVNAGTVDAIRQARFDTVFLGACAAGLDTGLTAASWNDAQVKRAAIASSTQVVLVASSDKFRRSATHRFAGFEDVDVVVTDVGLDAAERALLVSFGAQVVLVDA